MELTKVKFTVGQLVYGKLKGYPPWPALITKIQKNIATIVYFNANQQYSNISFNKLTPYHAGRKIVERYYNRDNKFSKAYDEMEVVWQLKLQKENEMELVRQSQLKQQMEKEKKEREEMEKEKETKRRKEIEKEKKNAALPKNIAIIIQRESNGYQTHQRGIEKKQNETKNIENAEKTENVKKQIFWMTIVTIETIMKNDWKNKFISA